MTPFEVDRAPLDGSNLIEAAAGTGKTFSLEGLFLRFVRERRTPVEEILVVTFTRAATGELRERLLKRLQAERVGAAPAAVSAESGDAEAAGRRIRRALMDFDQAAVGTIHGFCQRVLAEHAFETGSLFETELVPETPQILQEIADDCWRREVAAAPPEFTAYVLERRGGPEAFRRLLEAIKTPVFRIPPEPDAADGLEHLEAYRESLEALRRLWPDGRETIAAMLNAAPLDARTYGAMKPAGPAGGRTPREERTRALLAAAGTFLESDAPGFPPPAALGRLSADFIASKTLARREPPRLEFFDRCGLALAAAGRLEAEMAGRLLGLQRRLVRDLRPEMERRRKAQNVRSFDDLLTALATALEGRGGAALAESVRRKFRAVLVDEFQDTDALQVAILSGLFAEAGVPIFLIGDPKQAIYGFRGADIYSYLEASRRSQNVYTLTANRRSRPGLVAAVNAIFTQRPLPFLIPGIEFVPASAVRPPDASAGAALALWYLDSRRMRPDGRPVAKGVAEGFIARAVAADIARRLADARPGLRAGDIAVLVRTNRQARLTKAALARQRVPAVVCSAGDVFESPEAEELLRILAGIAEPSDPRRLRAALATAVMGAGVEEILACGLPEAGGDERLQRLRGYHQVWRSSGFMAMFRRLVSAEQVKPRLLGAPDGERRLTNLLHLAELLHRAESEESLGMGGLVKWLARRRRPEEPQREEHQLRLESDAGAVQIVTIHKSKGLQYPVVYCPFAWDASTVGAQAFFYHEPGAGHSLRLALEGEGGRGPMVQAERERLSENLRLLYVALTRAEERLVMVWGRINLTETSAPAYLFHSAGEESPAAEDEEADVLERLRAAMGAKTDADLLKDLDNLERRAAGAIAVVPVPAPPPAPALKPPSAPGRPLACRRFDGAIDRAWKTASYTLLVRAADHAGDGPARDHDAPALWPAPETPGEAPAAPDEPVLFAFPRGARAGTFFHEILEKDDFAPETGAERRQRVLQALSAHRFESAWCDPVCRRVSDLARLPLGAGAAGPRLAEVPAEDRRPEMEFYFPLKRLTPQSLERFFTRFSTAASGALGPAFCRQLGRLEFAPLEGYMKGFIDLVFRHEGRFFLIDWKSNHLGDRLEDYRRERLSARMQEELYTLQYHLYTLALHRYLALRVPGYRYEAHFGGVAYVFLRGVDPGRGPGFGVFSDRPAPDLVRAMEEELIAGHA